MNPGLIIKSSIDDIKWPAIPVPKASTTLAILFQLEQTQWWPPVEILSWQFHQLGSLLAHAYQNNPFYRDRLKRAGVKPEGTLSLEDWARIPLLTRADIQQAGDALESDNLSEDHGWTEEIFTSGSTGQPIRVVRTEVSMRLSSAFTVRDHLWHRRDVRGKLAVIRESGKGVDPWPDGSTFDHWGRSSGRLFDTGPCVALNVLCTVEQHMDWLSRENPEYLLTHPTIVDRLANYAIAHDIKLPNLRQVETISEILRPATRDACRKAWDVPVVDMYTTREIGYIALQCPDHETYHVQSEGMFVEVLDEDGLPCAPGETGRVVVTPLHNFAMPLIRYEIGDYAEVGEPCPCGRGLQVLRRILGRKQNMLIMPSGEGRWPLLSSGEIEVLLAIAPIKEYQFVQKKVEHIELRLATYNDLNVEQESALRCWVQEKFGSQFEVKITCFDKLPRSAAGKLQDFVSEVDQ